MDMSMLFVLSGSFVIKNIFATLRGSSFLEVPNERLAQINLD